MSILLLEAETKTKDLYVLKRHLPIERIAFLVYNIRNRKGVKLLRKGELRMMKKVLSVVLSVLLLCLSLVGLSACGNEGDENTFTFLIDSPEDATYYSDYNQNPVAIYTQHNQQYAGVDIKIEYKQLINGSQRDQYTTMISTGEYYDVMGTSYSPYSAAALNEMGIALELTEYVEKWMPNYMKILSGNENLQKVAYVVDENGEKHMYALWGCTDTAQYNWEGFCYRRDWIVKYGVNPSTGEAFTGGYTAERDAEGKNDGASWVDDVKFPSWYSDNKYAVEYRANHPEWDGSDPVFISDWEWMFEIFDKARTDLGVFDKGYDISIYYVGYMATGDLFSAFGGGSPMWSYNPHTGNVEFNATSESMQSYLECLNTWYEKGWLDKAFAEHSSDMFYQIDTAKVYNGYIGMWQGGRSTLAEQLEEIENAPCTENIYVAGAKQPINDLYGVESTKGKEPYSKFAMESVTTAIIVTEAAKDKNLEALFTYLDSFYDTSNENYITSNYGLTKEQYESIEEYQEKVNGQTFQERFGIQDGSYTTYEKDGMTVYKPVDARLYDSSLGNASKGNRMFRYAIIAECDELTANIYDSVVNQWEAYPNKGYIQGSITSLLTTEQADAYSKTNSKINDKMSVEIPKFINGTYDIYGADWDTFCKTINKMGHSKITGYLQAIYDSFK